MCALEWKKGRRAAPLHVASSGSSAQGIKPRPEISFGPIRLMVAAERVELGAELLQAGNEIGERLPEGEEESLVSGGLGSRLRGESGQGDEREDEEEDGRARLRPCCVGHG